MMYKLQLKLNKPHPRTMLKRILENFQFDPDGVRRQLFVKSLEHIDEK